MDKNFITQKQNSEIDFRILNAGEIISGLGELNVSSHEIDPEIHL